MRHGTQGYASSPAAIAERIRVARAARGWSQHDLARASRVSRGAIAHAEQGQKDLTVGMLCAIAAALGVRPGLLLDGVSP